MANLKRKVVTVNVDKMFFDNIFEPARKRTQEQLGISNLGQAKFTKMIERSGMSLDIKLKNMGVGNVIKPNNKRKKR